MANAIKILFVFTFCVVFLDVVVTLSKGSPCQTPRQESGECIGIRQCSSLLGLIQQLPIPSETANFLRSSQCGTEQGEPLVCCPVVKSTLGDISTDLLPNTGTCGKQLSDRIVGGELTEINEYPWMALLEYITDIDQSFRCGGSLVSSRYILTAGHCIKRIPASWRLINIRLGEYDLRNVTDCRVALGLEKCSDPPIDAEIEEIIVHNNYIPNSLNQENDIALIRLKNEVPFTEYVTPICIPLTSSLRNQDFSGQEMIVAGWGRTENQSQSHVKLQLEVPITPNADCKSTYGRAGVNLQDTQFCAGGENGKDSCTGDSGGPLMIKDKVNTNNWYAMGIVSMGPTRCGSRGWPGVYTRVSDFSKWIVDNIRP